MKAKPRHKVLPADHEPAVSLLRRRAREFERREARRKAERWLTINIPEHQGLPFGVAFFGDMHLDNPDCNVPRLLSDLDAVASAPGMFGVHVGDATDNWVGRLMSEFSKSTTTQTQARQLIDHVMHRCGVEWLLWTGGNHDKWQEGLAILGLLGRHAFYLPFWEARVVLRSGRQSWRVHVKHNFKGHSDWNITHGPLKAAFRESAADLYVCGHLHDWGTQQFEIAGMERVAHVARARGYKQADDYALEKGFQSSQYGAGIVAIFDPKATNPASRIIMVPDIAAGCMVLSALRRSRSMEDGGRKPKHKRNARSSGKSVRKVRGPRGGDAKPKGRNARPSRLGKTGGRSARSA